MKKKFEVICNEKEIGSSGAFNISENDTIKDEVSFIIKNFWKIIIIY